MNLFWLSYAADGALRGVVIIEGVDFIDACRRARALDISPGGQVLGEEIPDTPEAQAEVQQFGINRLILPHELVGYTDIEGRENKAVPN